MSFPIVHVVQVGNLSGKFGSLQPLVIGLNSKTVRDPTISLLGPAGILGRSLVFASQSGGAPTACLSLPRPPPALRMWANFTGTVTGLVMFSQSDVNSNTYVDVQLLTTLPVATLDWSIASSCSAGDLYNPAQASGLLCGPQWPQACAVGNLTAKFGDLVVAAGTVAALALDSAMPLSGPWGLLGRSVVLQANGQPVACANIVSNVTADTGTS